MRNAEVAGILREQAININSGQHEGCTPAKKATLTDVLETTYVDLCEIDEVIVGKCNIKQTYTASE